MNCFFFFFDTQKNKKSEIMITGPYYFFTSEQEQNQMFHICSCILRISMRMCRQCFNAAQLTARERGWRPRHWAALPVPDVPPCCRNNTRGGCPAFNKSHPVSFLCLSDTGEMLSQPQTNCDDTQHSLTEVRWLHTAYYAFSFFLWQMKC